MCCHKVHFFIFSNSVDLKYFQVVKKYVRKTTERICNEDGMEKVIQEDVLEY
jgi:hypothetical protein